MRIVLGADHAGFALKGPVLAALRRDGHDVIDVGIEIIRSFLAARFDRREEFVRRVAKLAEMERDASRPAP